MTKVLVPILVAAALASGTNGEPLLVAREDTVVLSRLPDVLSEEEVRPHLTKGLTNTATIRVEMRDLRSASRERHLGGGQVLIRYDLWDEVFLVQILDAAGREDRTFQSFEEMAAWWKDLELTVFAGAPIPPGTQAKVDIAVIPFSETEQNDAQRWFARSLQRAGRTGREEVESLDDDAVQTLSRTFHLLMATSIHREPLASHRFTISVLPSSP